jgi:hypothetical protein
MIDFIYDQIGFVYHPCNNSEDELDIMSIELGF